MRKFFIILISLILVISFSFMIIPAGLNYLFGSTNQPTSPMKAPTFEDNPSIFYNSFVTLVHNPLLEKEDELFLLYDSIKTREEAQIRFSELEGDLSALPLTPEHSHESFQPIYDAHNLVKSSLLLLIAKSKKSENFSTTTFFNGENLRPFYEDYLSQKENLYQVTIDTFKKHHIVFYLEEDGTISVYDP